MTTIITKDEDAAEAVRLSDLRRMGDAFTEMVKADWAGCGHPDHEVTSYDLTVFLLLLTEETARRIREEGRVASEYLAARLDEATTRFEAALEMGPERW